MYASSSRGGALQWNSKTLMKEFIVSFLRGSVCRVCKQRQARRHFFASRGLYDPDMNKVFFFSFKIFYIFFPLLIYVKFWLKKKISRYVKWDLLLWNSTVSPAARHVWLFFSIFFFFLHIFLTYPFFFSFLWISTILLLRTTLESTKF